MKNRISRRISHPHPARDFSPPLSLLPRRRRGGEKRERGEGRREEKIDSQQRPSVLLLF
jgi:hypothetical protein